MNTNTQTYISLSTLKYSDILKHLGGPLSPLSQSTHFSPYLKISDILSVCCCVLLLRGKYARGFNCIKMQITALKIQFCNIQSTLV